MSWTLYPISRFAEFASAWDTLAQARPGAPFLESLFMQPALAAFGDGSETLCLLHHDGALRAAAIVQPGPHGMWQTFQPSQLPLGAWINATDLDLAAASAELVKRLPGLALGIGLTQLDPLFAARPGDSGQARTQDYIATAWVDIDSSFDAYWEARGKNLKQNTRKQRNKLQADAIEPRMDCVTDAADVAQAIADYGSLESAGWKTANGTAIHPDNAQGRFYRAMLENFCQAGRGRIYRYRFGEAVVAMDLCITDGEVIVILKTTYDESYKAVSPSTLMRHAEFEHLFDEQRFKRIEFYGKVMEWHTRWTDKQRIVYHANTYRHALVLRLLALRERWKAARAPAPAAAVGTESAST